MGIWKQISFTLPYIVLSITVVTHIWNPAGFPALDTDEGYYMERSMHTIQGLGPQISSFYDHPYFGQLLLAALLSILGYPTTVNLNEGVHSVEFLYTVPRILMGIIAIFDTLLLYKISGKLYGRNTSIISCLFFSVLPFMTFTRRIYLDSLMLPFILLSVYIASRKNNLFQDNHIQKVLLSGTCLGLALFTKITAFTFIPLIAYILFRNYKNEHRKALFMLWLCSTRFYRSGNKEDSR